MKELSIEQKAKAYDKALADAKHYYEELDSDTTKNVLEEIFPVLNEIKSEKIRKSLISYFSNIQGFSTLEYTYGITPKETVAWLEKLGEQK